MADAVLAAGSALPAMDDLVGPWPGQTTILDGTATFWRATAPRSDSAEPALYLHGLGGSSLNWTDLAYLLADRFDGEAIDLPGFGLSEPARRYSVTAMARRVVRWLEHRDRGPVHLVGNSMGGAVAVRVAGSRPDLVRTLTLISPAMPFVNPRRSLLAHLMPLALIPYAGELARWRLARMEPEVLAQRVIEACFADPTRWSEQRAAEAAEEVRRRYEAPWYADAYLRSMRGLIGSFVRAYLPGDGSMWRIAQRVSAPTLVLTGREDRIVDVRVAPAVARVIPDSRLLVLDGVGHVAQMEQPALVARAVLGMIDSLAAAPTDNVTAAKARAKVKAKGNGKAKARIVRQRSPRAAYTTVTGRVRP